MHHFVMLPENSAVAAIGSDCSKVAITWSTIQRLRQHWHQLVHQTNVGLPATREERHVPTATKSIDSTAQATTAAVDCYACFVGSSVDLATAGFIIRLMPSVATRVRSAGRWTSTS